MIRSKKRLLKSQEGATAVEFAIVFPLLILLIMAMIEFGLYLFNRQVITNACREGARFGVVSRVPRYRNTDIEPVVLDYSTQHLVTFGNDNTLTVNLKEEVDSPDFDPDTFDPATQRCTFFSKEVDGTTYYCELEVAADYDYQFLFLSTIGIDQIQIHGEATMRME